jgi:ribosomal protein S14
MKNLIEKDKKIRRTFKNYEVKKKILNSISNNLYFDIKTRKLAYLELYNLPKNSSIVRTRRRCVLTGRSRAVYRNFKLCRNMFRSLALKGDLPGVCKVSW